LPFFAILKAHLVKQDFTDLRGELTLNLPSAVHTPVLKPAIFAE
jgi:hypothetical protein